MHCTNINWYCAYKSVLISPDSFTYNNVTIIQYRGSVDLNGEVFNINGDLTLGHFVSGSASISNGGFFVEGNVTKVGSGNIFGNASIRLIGGNTQSFSDSSTNFFTGPLMVDKSAGVVNQTTDLNLGASGQDLSLTSGSWDMAGFSLNVADTLTLDAGTSLTQNGGSLSYGTLINNGTLNP